MKMQSHPEYDAIRSFSTPNQSVDSLPKISITVLKSGYAESRAALMYDGGDWQEKIESVFVGVLVKHPKGTFLFDTGLGRNFSEQFADNTWIFRQLVEIKKLNPIADQLNDHHINPAIIDFVIPSHLHWDHAGGIEDFLKAPIWIQKAESDWARLQKLPDVMQKQFDDPAINWKFFELAAKPYELYSRSLDLFGDGSIILVPMEGHSPGTIGMILNFQSGRRMFFTSDCSWASEGITKPAEKSFLIMNFMKPDMDPHQVQSALIKAHQIKNKYPNMEIIPAHDGRVYEKLGYFPNWISE
jgi:glyoxylase-like metal-dependent hydrolase (beta-lactamase superfamily II)